MRLSATSGSRRRAAILLASFKVAAETESRLELQTKRVVAFAAAAFLGVFGGVFTGAAWHFYRPYRTPPQVFMVGGLGAILLALALLMLYFGLRRPDRIVIDGATREIAFDRRRNPLRLSFDRIKEVKVETENRSRRRERLIVRSVKLVTDGGETIEVDAGSDSEEMIQLAAKLRRVLGKPLPDQPS